MIFKILRFYFLDLSMYNVMIFKILVDTIILSICLDMNYFPAYDVLHFPFFF